MLIDLVLGETRTVAQPIVDDDGLPYDCTGKTVVLAIKAKGAVLRIEADFNDPTDGVALFTFEPTDYRAIPPGIYQAAVWVVDGLDVISTWSLQAPPVGRESWPVGQVRVIDAPQAVA